VFFVAQHYYNGCATRLGCPNTFGGSDPPRTNENIKDFIKTFNTKTTPECYLSFIRENFQPDVGQNLHLDRLLLT
jgi:hypothetical protein